MRERADTLRGCRAQGLAPGAAGVKLRDVRWLVVLALLLPLPLMGVGSAHLADNAGRALGARLDRVTSTLLRAPPDEPAVVAVVSDEPGASEVRVLASTSKRSKRHAKHAKAAQAPRAIFVSAPVVLRLANRGARPHGVPVAPSGKRPAGLLLVGVGTLGVGLRDGDVLTQVAGQPALNVAGVIGAVLSARGRGARTISGRFWRNGEEWTLVVEQPYPPAQAGRVSVDERGERRENRGA